MGLDINKLKQTLLTAIPFEFNKKIGEMSSTNSKVITAKKIPGTDEDIQNW